MPSELSVLLECGLVCDGLGSSCSVVEWFPGSIGVTTRVMDRKFGSRILSRSEVYENTEVVSTHHPLVSMNERSFAVTPVVWANPPRFRFLNMERQPTTENGRYSSFQPFVMALAAQNSRQNHTGGIDTRLMSSRLLPGPSSANIRLEFLPVWLA